MHIRVDEEITFRKLETLLALMETGMLSRAAERLEVSTVSVHRAVHSLEAGVRCALFRHEGRKLCPTDAAHALAGVAREVLQTMSEGVRTTREAGGYSADRIRIGALHSLTIDTVPAMLVGMNVRSPALQTELVLASSAELLRQLRDGAIDAALMARPEGGADLVSQLLFEDDIFFAAPAGSRYAALQSVDLGACRDQDFVSLADGFASYDGGTDAFRAAGFTPRVVMRTGDIFSLMNLVSGGIGCALLPGRVRDVFPREVQLIPLQPRYRMHQSLVLAFLRTRERDPNLLALLAVCRCARG